uniref:Secreted protein n=1 Tax=Rhipicephalus appendiculatus TaxID=34631 RepID=A0A131YFC3_RHIAP
MVVGWAFRWAVLVVLTNAGKNVKHATPIPPENSVPGRATTSAKEITPCLEGDKYTCRNVGRRRKRPLPHMGRALACWYAAAAPLRPLAAAWYPTFFELQ